MKTEHTREELELKAHALIHQEDEDLVLVMEYKPLAIALLEAYEEIEGFVDALVWLSYEQQCKCWCKKPARPSERMGVPHDNTCNRIATAFHNRKSLLRGKES